MRRAVVGENFHLLVVVLAWAGRLSVCWELRAFPAGRFSAFPPFFVFLSEVVMSGKEFFCAAKLVNFSKTPEHSGVTDIFLRHIYLFLRQADDTCLKMQEKNNSNECKIDPVAPPHKASGFFATPWRKFATPWQKFATPSRKNNTDH